jgi:hypothetical protein
MNSIVICKSESGISIIATGDYGELNSMLPYFRKITDGNEIKLVSIAGLDIENIMKDQTLINKTFESEFKQ